MTSATLELRHGALRAQLRPHIGGSLSGLWCLGAAGREIEVLRAASDTASSPREMASFPLVPFCNRIEDGTFVWNGRRVRLPPNAPGDPFPLHGYGWLASWQVESAEASWVELRLDYANGEWPWPFTARQRVELNGDVLLIALSVENRGDSPMPAGLGHHPYFPRTPRTLVRARLPTLVETDARLIPTRRIPNPLDAQFARGCPIDTLRLDNGYTGWDGYAVIEQPDDDMRVEMQGEPGQAFHLYVPDGRFFCAEAVTNEPNALNDLSAGAPMRALEPGRRLDYLLRLRMVV